MTQFSVNSWSFFNSGDRTIEQRLWGRYAETAGVPLQQKGQKITFDTMTMWKRADVVCATALSLIGIEQITRPLPYEIEIPRNLLTWENGTQTRPVQSAQTFYDEMLQAMYGVACADTMVGYGDLWIVVDPHLLSDVQLRQLAKELIDKRVLVVLPEGELVPPALRAVCIQENNRAFSINSSAPFSEPAFEEAVALLNPQFIVVVGAGARLFPVIIGACDYVLLYTPTMNLLSYEDRRARCNESVAYVSPLCVFDERWYTDEKTLEDALMAYLQSWGYRTDPVDNPQDYKLTGGFQIAPNFHSA